MSSRTNLVLARVGSNSLHPCWADAGKPRDWDLYLAPFQEIPSQGGRDCEVGAVVAGPKWSGVRDVLNRWDGWRDYEYIWIPDDDIYANQATISRMFEVAREVGLDLFAPALHESSHFAHFITMENRRFYGRWVGFVEIMVPGFRTSALEALLHTLDLTETGWGWGLDSLWPKLLEYENGGIIGGTPVIHTRPVGRMREGELAERVLAESDRILADNDCRPLHVTFGGFHADLADRVLSPEQLLVEVVEGSRYLWERDPRVLAWIMEFQRGASPWPEYPIAGTPEGAASPSGIPLATTNGLPHA